MYSRAVLCAFLMVTPAVAEELVVMKAGEWVHATSVNGGTPRPQVKSCTKTDEPLTDADVEKSVRGSACTFNHTRAGNIITFNGVCAASATRMTIVLTVTLSSSDDYTVSSKIHMENPPNGLPPEIKLDEHWTRTGPCQPGDKIEKDP